MHTKIYMQICSSWIKIQKEKKKVKQCIVFFGTTGKIARRQYNFT